MRRSIDELKVKAEEASAEQDKTLEQMKDLKASVADIKLEVEKDISKRYKGRKVTLSGS